MLLTSPPLTERAGALGPYPFAFVLLLPSGLLLSLPFCRPYLPRPAPLIPVPEGEEPGAAWCGRCAWLYSSPAPSMLPMPMLAISALKLLWCIDDALDNGIFLFFLLLVFSKLSYPSALDVTEPGPPTGFPPRDASIKRRCTESSGAFILAAIGPIVAYR